MAEPEPPDPDPFEDLTRALLDRAVADRVAPELIAWLAAAPASVLRGMLELGASAHELSRMAHHRITVPEGNRPLPASLVFRPAPDLADEIRDYGSVGVWRHAGPPVPHGTRSMLVYPFDLRWAYGRLAQTVADWARPRGYRPASQCELVAFAHENEGSETYAGKRIVACGSTPEEPALRGHFPTLGLGEDVTRAGYSGVYLWQPDERWIKASRDRLLLVRLP